MQSKILWWSCIDNNNKTFVAGLSAYYKCTSVLCYNEGVGHVFCFWFLVVLEAIIIQITLRRAIGIVDAPFFPSSCWCKLSCVSTWGAIDAEWLVNGCNYCVVDKDYCSGFSLTLICDLYCVFFLRLPPLPPAIPQKMI